MHTLTRASHTSMLIEARQLEYVESSFRRDCASRY